MDIDPLSFRNARLAAGLTQTEAAALIYSRWRTVQDWEAGIYPVDPARYRLFLHLTGLERLPFGRLTATEISPESNPAGNGVENPAPARLRTGRQKRPRVRPGAV